MAQNNIVDYSAEGGVYDENLRAWVWIRKEKPGYYALVSGSGTNVRWYANAKDDPKEYNSKEAFDEARYDYLREHGISVSGRLTKRATPDT